MNKDGSLNWRKQKGSYTSVGYPYEYWIDYSGYTPGKYRYFVLYRCAIGTEPVRLGSGKVTFLMRLAEIDNVLTGRS